MSMASLLCPSHLFNSLHVHPCGVRRRWQWQPVVPRGRSLRLRAPVRLNSGWDNWRLHSKGTHSSSCWWAKGAASSGQRPNLYCRIWLDPLPVRDEQEDGPGMYGSASPSLYRAEEKEFQTYAFNLSGYFWAKSCWGASAVQNCLLSLFITYLVCRWWIALCSNGWVDVLPSSPC